MSFQEPRGGPPSISLKLLHGATQRTIKEIQWFLCSSDLFLIPGQEAAKISQSTNVQCPAILTNDASQEQLGVPSDALSQMGSESLWVVPRNLYFKQTTQMPLSTQKAGRLLRRRLHTHRFCSLRNSCQ